MYCKHCLTDKEVDQFYASNKSKCKDCVKSTVHKNRQENLERIRAYDRLRGSLPYRVAERAAYQQTNAYSQSHKAAVERWSAKHPERRKASYMVSNAVRHGKLQKQPCFYCGNTLVEGHHPDYSKPLDVVWLCTAHHKQVHDELETA